MNEQPECRKCEKVYHWSGKCMEHRKFTCKRCGSLSALGNRKQGMHSKTEFCSKCAAAVRISEDRRGKWQ